MNKQDLIKALIDEQGLSRLAAENSVNKVFVKIEDAIARGEEVRISGFGTFKRVETKARTCRNPHTGEAVEVPAGHKVKFKVSSKFLTTPERV